ncbi:MAG: hypothetical protein K2Y40_12590 [Reyranella sp.]|jgi:hypothetical protein|nr:hypothetical protein [Reyranella sp.]
MAKLTYNELLRQDRRLTILRVLEGAQGKGANESQLERLCVAHQVWSTRAQIRTELLWLEQQGFVLIEDLEGFMLATATDEGIKLALGQLTHPDITAPSSPRRK